MQQTIIYCGVRELYIHETKHVQEKLETPYFLIDKQKLDDNIKDLKNALATCWNNYIIGYSVKTNSLPWLICYFKNRGIFAEVVSDDEYNLVLKLGYAKDKLIYNGPIKSKHTFFTSNKKRLHCQYRY